MKNNNDIALRKEQLLAESLLYSLLGRVLYNQPEEEWLNTLIKEDVFSEIPFAHDRPETKKGQELLQGWAEQYPEGLDQEALKALKAEYTRLFVGVEKVLVPPWESVYFTEDRLIFQQQTLDVRNWYRRFGLEPENLHKEPDDHIGLEMSFIAYLAELGVKALEEKDEEKYSSLVSAKREFLSSHLLKWGLSWCALVKQHARNDFYLGLGYLTAGALFAIAGRYEIQISQEAGK